MRLRFVRWALLASVVASLCAPTAAIAAGTTKTPVLLVHGLTSKAAMWKGWTDSLGSPIANTMDVLLYKTSSDVFGSDVPVYVLDYRGFGGAMDDIPRTARFIPWAIDQILAEHPEHKKVFVATHSMGGVLTRYYMEGLLPGGSPGRKYGSDIASLITLDTPHGGCGYSDGGVVRELLARLFTGTAGQQLDPDSKVIKALTSSTLQRESKYAFVVGNHYPLLGDGLLTVEEQLPYGWETQRLPAGTRTIFVDAVHTSEIGISFYQAWLALHGKKAGEKATPLRSVVDTEEAREAAKAAYDRVAVERTALKTPPTPSKDLHHPAFGSEERKAILNALRPVIERDLGQKVIFEVSDLAAKEDFVFAAVVPRKPSGAKIDYSKTRYASLLRQGWFDGGSDADVFALLRFQKGTWHVMTFVIGPTDVAYVSWWREYGAPKAIFPHTE
ncbi:MAG: alpha/beta fold hydrolase [Actinomycetota bacterium]|nr:alpha/beta fold hydrolase [Actinomycetota bacterium]